MAAEQSVSPGKGLEHTAAGTRALLDWRPEVLAGTWQPKILIVDGTESGRHVLRSMLRQEGCVFLEASQASEALAILERESVDLIILEMILPGMNGSDLCARLKSDRRTMLVPVLMVTSVPGVEHEILCLNSGADDLLAKPLHPQLVRARVRAMLRQKAALDTLEEAETILFALAQSIEARDRYTHGHCQRLAAFSVALGKALGLGADELVALYRGGYLHDIGKVAIPDAILFKPGPLTGEEWEQMRQHPIIGEEICRPMRTLAAVLPIIRHHHERWDGSGYPDGLRGENIPLLARILQLADIYDALTTERPYKGAMSQVEALGVLEEEARSGWRDPELVAIFRDVCLAGVVVPEPTPISASLENLRRGILGDLRMGEGKLPGLDVHPVSGRKAGVLMPAKGLKEPRT
jgi:putative two-component system response regulator